MSFYNTLPEAIADLQLRGYTEDFNLRGNFLQCRRAGVEISPDEFEVSEYYRFDINTDPDDESVVYGIISEKYGLKGRLSIHTAFMLTAWQLTF